MKTISDKTLARLHFSGSEKCEEANMFGVNIPSPSGPIPAPCGEPATHLMACEKDGNIYAMCDMCADHNTRRGMIAVTKERVELVKKEAEEIAKREPTALEFEAAMAIQVTCGGIGPACRGIKRLQARGFVVATDEQFMRLRDLSESFEIVNKEDGIWLILHGNGDGKQAMFNLTKKAGIAGMVALGFEEARRAALKGALNVKT